MKFKKGTLIDEMLLVKPFAQLLADGDILDTQGCADKTGYHFKHIHRLCRERAIPHFRRGFDKDEVQFFFYAWALAELFETCSARVRATAASRRQRAAL